ncbi:putative VQ motif-containing protein [Melia azedarach]|uniref:VQ motif-containing protein n=1 Tax=Melia azedarach TaxID=155640 RepID=A0ACC1WW45_MELAZ|nr:putative VQ motif-containing protein [Melia azedarach]
MSSSSEWMQYYQQITMDEDHVASSIAFSDAIAVTTGAGAASESILSPSNSCSMNDQLIPKGCVSKPVRRRSRPSKKTPTTLLNANANNFRALVQQFTGCPSKSFSFGSNKGPVNLNFGLANEQNERYEPSLTAAFGNYNDYNNNHNQQSELLQPQQQQQISEEQRSLVSFDEVNADAFSATPSNFINPNGFSMDDVYFHEIGRDVFSCEGKNDSYLL